MIVDIKIEGDREVGEAQNKRKTYKKRQKRERKGRVRILLRKQEELHTQE